MTTLSPLAKVIYERLTGDATLMARLRGVFDFVPEDVAAPYVTLGPGTTIPFDTFTSDGGEHTVNVHTWSQERGQKEAQEIMKLIYDLLHNVTLAPVGHTVIVSQFEFGELFKDPDGVTHHGVQRFRVITEEV